MNLRNELRSLLTELAAGWRRIAAGAAGQSLAALPWRNGLFVLFLAGILAYGVFFAWYLLVSFDLLNLVRDVNHDDSFYYFQLARNLAAGQFSTFDGGITQTNGYQPLWLLLLTPFYWALDGETALFGIKAFEIILIAGAVLLIVAAARLTGQPWLLLFALLPLLYQNRVLFSGMETAAALFMLGLLFAALALYARDPARWQGPLAGVAFLLPWARLEYIAIALTATAAVGAMAVWRSEPAADAAGGGWAAWRSRIAPAMVTPFLGAVAGILVYFAYNGLVFGGIVPVSGAVKNAWSQQLWDLEGGYSLVRNFGEVLQVPVFGYELLIALEVCVYAPLVWWLARRSGRRQDWLLLAFLAGVFSLGVGHIAKFIQTGLTVHPTLQGQFPWYFVPAYLLAALIIPARCFVALYLLRRFIGSRWQRTGRLLSVGVVVIGAALLLARADFGEPFRYAGGSSAIIHKDQWAAANYMGGQVANRILPEGSVIGSWDAGVIGYFSRFPVVNLDGLVNSYDYFRAINADTNRQIASEGDFRPLYRDLGITHLANSGTEDFENTIFRGTLDSSGRWLRIGAAAAASDGATAARLWEGLAPHFDYQEGEVGLLVANRVALAVARNCAPEEIIVWSWDLPGARPAFQPGMNTGRRPGGLCISEAVLPAAAAVDSARVRTMPAADYLARLGASRLPALRSRYDVYLTENNLIYAKEQCVAEDRSRFLLHLYPANPEDLPEWGRPHGFVNWDFDFGQFGTQAGGICLVNVPLPRETARIRTGQFREAGGVFTNLWEEDLWTAAPPS